MPRNTAADRLNYGKQFLQERAIALQAPRLGNIDVSLQSVFLYSFTTLSMLAVAVDISALRVQPEHGRGSAFGAPRAPSQGLHMAPRSHLYLVHG